MASGVTVTDQAKEMFDKIKLIDKDNRVRVVTFTLQCNNKVIDVEKVYTEKMLGKDGLPEDPFQLCKSLAKDACCFYALYDCHFDTEEGLHKEELVFTSWIPEGVCIKDKMLYSSSQEALKKCFRGIKHSMELHDTTDWDCDNFVECLERLTPHIISMEGKAIPGKQMQCHR